MRFDLKKPCKNCPFRTDGTAIRFACRDRAEEIEERAYRYGFPCHLSAEEQDQGDGETGFEFGGNTQHCAGALIMYLRHGDSNVPFDRLSESKQDKIRERLDFKSPVFEDEDAFLNSYGEAGA